MHCVHGPARKSGRKSVRGGAGIRDHCRTGLWRSNEGKLSECYSALHPRRRCQERLDHPPQFLVKRNPGIQRMCWKCSCICKPRQPTKLKHFGKGNGFWILTQNAKNKMVPFSDIWRSSAERTLRNPHGDPVSTVYVINSREIKQTMIIKNTIKPTN